MSISLKFLLWSSLALLLLQTGFGEKCDSKSSEPTVEKMREPTKFRVEVMNKCPIINLRLKYQGFPQSLVDPTLLRVLSSSAGNCAINDGLSNPDSLSTITHTSLLGVPFLGRFSASES